MGHGVGTTMVARSIKMALVATLISSGAFAQEVIDNEVDNSRIEEFQTPAIDAADLDTPSFGTSIADPGLPSADTVLAPPVAEQSYKSQIPKKGGKFKLQHPGSADGLIKIDKSGYQYKVPLKDKSQATSFRFAALSTPKITSAQGVTFGQMYGGSGLAGILGEYEWMPFRGFGALGLQFGFGLVVARGNGRITIGSTLQSANEVYTLFVVPMSALVVYRFEYFRKQWIVPFVNGGATYFALAEKRDDSKPEKYAGAPAAVFGGGLHFGVSRLDLHSAFILSKEYGVADVWFTVEARVVAGLKQTLDFSSQAISAGFTIDY